MKLINLALSLLILILAGYLAYIIYKPIQFEKEKSKRYAAVIDQLKQIRTTQLAYKIEHGQFTPSFDSLVNFAKNGQFTIVKMIGNPDDSTAVIIRDTSYLSVKDSLFRNTSIDSLPFIPYTSGSVFEMNAGIIEKGRVKVPVFEVSDTDPYDPNQVLKVGSMIEPTNAGNWE